MPNSLPHRRPIRASLVCLLALLPVLACGGDRETEESPATAVVTPEDTAVTSSSATTSAAGPASAVTSTDMRSVTDAAEYRLTPDNFARFMRASESLARLIASDTATARFLAADADTGATDLDAGVRRLSSRPAVRSAIEGAGLTVRQYFIMSIAIESARRFMDTPDAAPPTPTLRDNALFLRGRRAEVVRLQQMGTGT